MDTNLRATCLALLMLVAVSWSPASRAQAAPYEECDCRLGCVPGADTSGAAKGSRVGPRVGGAATIATSTTPAAPGGQRKPRLQECLIRMSSLTFVGPSIRTFVLRVRDTSLSEKILRYFDAMLSSEFALHSGNSDARAQ